MRTALRSISEVCHYWANQTQPEGRAGNVFFDDNKIYSYGRHFCIARIVPSGAAVFTDRGYSMSTSKHVGKSRQAASHRTIVYCNDPAASLRENAEHARASIKSALDSVEKPRIRQTTRDAFKAHALHCADRFNAYRLALPDAEQIGTPAIDTSNLEHIREALQAAEREHAENMRKQQAARIAELAEKLDAWRAGAVDASGLYNIPPALRLQGDIVRTSHGAEIPVADARTLWPLILKCRAGSREFTPGMPLGHYRLSKIRADGSIVVGCHDIAFGEIEIIAAALGINAGVTA